MSKYKTTHLPPDEIDNLRLKAFETNEKWDVEAYYRAASLYFQERHERAMNRADLCTPTDERVKALEAENARLRGVMGEVLSKLDRDGMKPGWGVVRDWLRAALNDGASDV